MTRRKPKIAPARLAALNALLAVEANYDLASSEALDAAAREFRLDERDAGLAAAIFYGTLRRAHWLDWQYEPFLKRADLDPGLRAVLRMVAFQKFLLERVPPHAIVNDATELARTVAPAEKGASAFVNAIARRIVEMPTPRDVRVSPEISEDKRRAILHSVPPWLVRLFDQKFSCNSSEQILAQSDEEAPITIRPNLLRVRSAEALSAELRETGIETHAGALVPTALHLAEPGNVRQLLQSAAFAAGKFYLQDEASQAVALIADPRPGERILDICAAPGGKTTHLAELTHVNSQVIATDVSPARLELLRENIMRLGTPGISIVALHQLAPDLAIQSGAAIDQSPDPSCRAGILPATASQTASEIPEPVAYEKFFNLLLLDAPCSGLGTLRRHPEIRYRITQPRVDQLGALQRRILRAASNLVAPGGRIVYSTCTITDRENRSVIDSFLRERPDFAIAESTTEIPSIRGMRHDDGFYRTWPRYLDADGFEAVILKRKV